MLLILKILALCFADPPTNMFITNDKFYHLYFMNFQHIQDSTQITPITDVALLQFLSVVDDEDTVTAVNGTPFVEIPFRSTPGTANELPPPPPPHFPHYSTSNPKQVNTAIGTGPSATTANTAIINQSLLLRLH